MKWISQHIYDFVSRFRNDVYLENLSTTTETSALVVDSNGKVSKNTTSGVNMTNGADNRVVTAVGTSGLNAETYLSFENTGNVSSLAIISNLDPPNDYFLIQTSEHGATTISTVDDDATAAHLTLQPDGNIVLDPASQIITADAYSFALSSSTLGPVLTCTNNVNDGAGGYLELRNNRDGNGLNDGDELGVVQFTGADAAGTYQIYSRIISDVIESDHGSETGQLEFKVAEYDGTLTTGLAVLGTTTDGRVDVTMGTLTTSVVTIVGSLTMGITPTINSSGVIQVASQPNITSLGTLTNLQVDSVNINDKSIEILGDTGDTFNITTGAAGATTLTTTDAAATAGHFEIAADGDITLDAAGNIALETPSGQITGDAAAYVFSHTGGERPAFTIQNTADDATGPNFIISNIRDGNGLNDGDSLGTISFNGDDAAGGSEGYVTIQGVANETAHGDECGTLNFYVANNGTLKEGIIISADSGTTSEVDVTIANGTASNTVVAGNLQVTTGIDLGSTDTTLARSAAGKVTIEGNEILTTATTEGVVRNYTTTIDQATMNALHTTAVELVAMPGSGKQVLPLDCWLRVTRNATQLNNVALSLSWNSDVSLAGAAFYQKGFMRNKTTIEFIRLVRYTNYLGNFATDNRPLTLMLTGAITSNSVTSMKVHLQYIIIDV